MKKDPEDMKQEVREAYDTIETYRSPVTLLHSIGRLDSKAGLDNILDCPPLISTLPHL